MKDDKTLVMISAVKSINANFKYDIFNKKLELFRKKQTKSIYKIPKDEEK